MILLHKKVVSSLSEHGRGSSCFVLFFRTFTFPTDRSKVRTVRTQATADSPTPNKALRENLLEIYMVLCPSPPLTPTFCSFQRLERHPHSYKERNL